MEWMLIGLIISVCLSVRVIKLENCWTDLDEIWYEIYASGDYPKIILQIFYAV
jgi:hypothetical protein